MIEAIPGEAAATREALPPRADDATADAIAQDVHQEAVASVMAQGDFPRRHVMRGYGSDLPPRPTSGPVTATARSDRS